MNVVSRIKNRIDNECNAAASKSFINNKGVGALLEVSVDISIQEIKALSKSQHLTHNQRQEAEQRIKTYYEGVEMFGENRVLPRINQYGNIIIWID